MKNEQQASTESNRKLLGITYGFGTYSQKCLVNIFEESSLFYVTPMGCYSYVIKPANSQSEDDHLTITDFTSGAQDIYGSGEHVKPTHKKAVDSKVQEFVNCWIPQQWKIA